MCYVILKILHNTRKLTKQNCGGNLKAISHIYFFLGILRKFQKYFFTEAIGKFFYIFFTQHRIRKKNLEGRPKYLTRTFEFVCVVNSSWATFTSVTSNSVNASSHRANVGYTSTLIYVFAFSSAGVLHKSSLTFSFTWTFWAWNTPSCTNGRATRWFGTLYSN